MAGQQKAPAFPAFSAADFFGGGWRVRAFAPGRRAVLEQSQAEQSRALGRLVAVILFPAVVGIILFLATQHADGDVRLITYPLVALCALVVALGVMNLARTVRRARHGVRLEVDQAKVLGFPEARGGLADYSARLTELPRAKVREVKVALFRAGERERAGKATGVLTVECEGVSLQGPTVQVPDPEWEVARDRLGPLACELARIAQVDAVVGDARISADQLSARPLPDAFEVLSPGAAT